MKQIKEKLLNDSDTKYYNTGETIVTLLIILLGCAALGTEGWLVLKNAYACSTVLGGIFWYTLTAFGIFLVWALAAAALVDINTIGQTKTMAPSKKYVIIEDKLFFKKGREYFLFNPKKVLNKISSEDKKVFEDLPKESRLELLYREYYKNYDFYNGTRPKYVVAEERTIS